MRFSQIASRVDTAGICRKARRKTWETTHTFATWSDGETSHDLYVRNEFAMKYLLRKMRPETLGRIIASAKPVKPGSRKMSIKDVNPWPSLDRGGMEILYDFACATIVAEMMDIIMARRSKDRIGDDVQSDDLINHMSTGNSSEHDIPL
ncbi:MAG: hypothetical protein UX72_C0039G0011 [Parcubacteria group bacterium GW2011_GWA2_47_10]|nr:MAG: hypothetical protein UX72_C0039G0011 [Parcubacteria group bacterium GW2011_GWA2_47_10]